MNKLSYKIFKMNYLNKFRMYYKMEDCNRKELKRSVFDNPKLTELQKVRFWKLVKGTK